MSADPLENAIKAISEDLIGEGWCLDEGEPVFNPDGYFSCVLRKHLQPVLGNSGWREARIAGLQAEIDWLARHAETGD